MQFQRAYSYESADASKIWIITFVKSGVCEPVPAVKWQMRSESLYGYGSLQSNWFSLGQ